MASYPRITTSTTTTPTVALFGLSSTPATQPLNVFYGPLPDYVQSISLISLGSGLSLIGGLTSDSNPVIQLKSIVAGDGITLITDAETLKISATATGILPPLSTVIPGSYDYPRQLVVDQYGRVTSIAAGSQSVGPNGPIGQTGLTGQAGPAGAQGLIGLTGPAGSPGAIDITPIIASGSTTARNSIARFADVMDVRDYGVVGTGLIDDTAALQVAINAAAGKANLRIPAALTIAVTGSINIPSNSYIELNGTITQLANTTAVDLLSITGNNVMITGNGTIDGNRANQPLAAVVIPPLNKSYTNNAGQAIKVFNNHNIFINGINIINASNNAIYLLQVSNAKIENCTFSNCSDGVVFVATQNSRISNCISHDNDNYGYAIVNGSSYCSIINSNAFNCNRGIYIVRENNGSTVANLMVSTNVIYNNRYNGIYCLSLSSNDRLSHIIFTDNFSTANGNISTVGSSNYYLNNMVDCLFSGNMGDNVIGADPSYCMQLSGYNSRTHIVGNTLKNATTNGSVLDIVTVNLNGDLSVIVEGNLIATDQIPGPSYGIYISAGTATGTIIRDNTFTGNFSVSGYASLNSTTTFEGSSSSDNVTNTKTYTQNLISPSLTLARDPQTALQAATKQYVDSRVGVGSAGPQGPIGQTGLQGIAGPVGGLGPAGSPGNTGSQGPIGLSGLQGLIGPAGLSGPIRNVTDFAVVGDGVTDDTVNLQSALTNNAGKFTILIPMSMTCMIKNTLVIPANTRLVIDGKIVLAAHSNSVVDMIQIDGGNVLISGLGTLDGNAANQHFTGNAPPCGLITSQTRNYPTDSRIFSNVRIQGITVTNVAGSPMNLYSIKDSLIDGCTFSYSPNSAQILASTNTHIYRCLVNNITDKGIGLRGGNNYCSIRESSVHDCLTGPFIFSDNNQTATNVYCQILDNTVWNNTNTGISIDTILIGTQNSNIIVAGNLCFNNGFPGLGNFLLSNVSALKVTDNLATINGSTKLPTSLTLSGNLNNVTISNNTLQGNLSDSIIVLNSLAINNTNVLIESNTLFNSPAANSNSTAGITLNPNGSSAYITVRNNTIVGPIITPFIDNGTISAEFEGHRTANNTDKRKFFTDSLTVGVASGSNGIDLTSGSVPVIRPNSSNANASLVLQSKGNGSLGFGTSNNNIILQVADNGVTNNANYLLVKGGVPVSLSVAGVDANISLSLNPKGTGQIVANGPVMLQGDPTMPLQAATKQYVDNPSNTLPFITKNTTTARLLADRLADVMDVRDFGVVGDGVTNDTVNFQAAIMTAASNKTRLRVPNSFIVMLNATIIVPANSYLQLDGTLRLISQAMVTILRLTGDNTVITGSGTIDGNRAQQSLNSSSTGVDGITTVNPINNVTIAGITIINTVNWPIDFFGATNSRIENCTIHHTTNSARLVSSTNSHFLNCIVHDVDDRGICLHGGNSFCTIVDCTVYNCSYGPSILSDANQLLANISCVISNNIVYNNYTVGISVSSTLSSLLQSHILISNNLSYNNGRSDIPNGANYAISNTTDALISGNVGDGILGAQPSYCSIFSGVLTNVKVVSNTFKNAPVGSAIVILNSVSNVNPTISFEGNTIVNDQVSTPPSWGLYIEPTNSSGVVARNNNILGTYSVAGYADAPGLAIFEGTSSVSSDTKILSQKITTPGINVPTFASTSFWTDRSPAFGTKPSISRLGDRVTIGQANSITLDTVDTNGTWASAYGLGWMEIVGTLIVNSTASGGAIVGMTQTSDSKWINSTSAFSYLGFSVANTPNTVAECAYFEAQTRAAGSSAYVIEGDAVQMAGPPPTCNPFVFNAGGGAYGVMMAAGGDATLNNGLGQTVYNSSFAFGVGPNKTVWNRGIVISAAGLARSGGTIATDKTNNIIGNGVGIAFDMASGHQMQWIFDYTGVQSGYIRSDATTANVGLVFTNAGLTIQSNAQANSISTPTSALVTIDSFGNILAKGNINGALITCSEVLTNVVQVYGPLLATGIVTLGATTVSGLNLGSSAASGYIVADFNGIASSHRQITWSTAGIVRWQMGMIGNAETGSNAGGDWALASFIDIGPSGGSTNIMTAKRSTGLLTVFGSPTDVLGIATKGYVDTAPTRTVIAAASGSISMDCSRNGSTLDLTLSGNTTVTLTNTSDNAHYNILVQQAASGGPFTLTIVGAIWAGGTALVVSTTANALDRVDIQMRGTTPLATFKNAFA